MQTQVDTDTRITTGINRPTGNYIYHDRTHDYKQFEFKLAGKCVYKTYWINIYATMKDFIDIMKPELALDFGFLERYNDADKCIKNLDIIEAGQFNNINGHDAELAPALEPSEILFKDYFNKRINHTAFYIIDRHN